MSESVPHDTHTDDAKARELAGYAFKGRLRERDVRGLLAHLNGLTTHRFTGIYRFEPGWVVSLALFDREDPQALTGADVKMKESYCWLTGLDETAYVIEDATTDARLAGHAAQEAVRSYVAVLLKDRDGTPWGTLCHFDFAPRAPLPKTLAELSQVRPLLEELLVRDAPAQWHPDAPSIARPRVTA